MDRAPTTDLTACLTGAELQTFTDLLGTDRWSWGPDFLGNATVIIHAEVGDVVWRWFDSLAMFCWNAPGIGA
jgi:hypothetical protein